VAALQGNVREHHCFLLANHLSHIDFLEEQIALFDEQIVSQLQLGSNDDPVAAESSTPTVLVLPGSSEPHPVAGNPGLPPLGWQEAVTLLDGIPGIGRRTAELVIAEIGSDMSRFPSAAHLARWTRLCPGNYESAGKRPSGRTGPGNRWLRSALVQAAQAAVHCRDTYFGGLYHRLVYRRGKNRVIVAVAHHLLTAIYHMLQKHEPFQDLEANYWDERQKSSLVRRLCSRIRQLGYQVNLEPVGASIAE
jgi:transposase